jgi:putative phosphoribosyl transferase
MGDEQPVRIPLGDVELDGDLAHGTAARALVLFAHGSGSSRHSPRNRFVAAALREGGLATLLVDLLSPAEEEEDLRTRRLRFDIELLAARLMHIATWLRAQPGTSMQPIGLFGASTGGGAALAAAARLPDEVGAVVSRGGRPDLAGAALRSVRAPTLLLVGGLDTQVIELNQQALGELRCPKKLEIVAGASHLFEEPGTLEKVAARARTWFVTHLVEGGAPSS